MMRQVIFMVVAAWVTGLWCAGSAAAAEVMSETAERVAGNLGDAYGLQDPMTKDKASKKHDRVTIVINKQSDAKIEATTDLEKESSLKSTITEWFTLKVDKDGNLVANPRTGNQKPEADVSFEREHSAEGETERKQSLKNKISGEVLDVLPNGQLIVVARTEITVNEEKESVELTGRVDPKDMTPESTVDADYMIDLRYKILGKGDVADTIKRGWFAKLVDKFNPF